MKNKHSIIILCIVMGAMLIWYKKGSDKASPLDSDVIIVGTNAEYFPFTWINEQGIIEGFDIDIAAYVVQALGKKMKIKDMSFDMLIPEAQIGAIHLIAAGLTPTQERSQHVIFTKPYLKGEPLIAVTLKKNAISDVNQLQGKEVVVNEGYVSDNYASSLEDVKVKRLPSPAESMLDLQTEKSFAYITTLNSIQPFLKQMGQELFSIFVIPDLYENYAMAISKSYPELLHQIQSILDRMESNGTIQMLKKKWNLE